MIPDENSYDDILVAIDRARVLSKTRRVILAKQSGVKTIDMSYWGPEGWSPSARQRAKRETTYEGAGVRGPHGFGKESRRAARRAA